MNDKPIAPFGCECCVNRRRFLAAGCGVCAASAVSHLLARPAAAAPPGGAAYDSRRPRVRLVFACFTVKQERPTWPHIGYDFAPDIERV
ncbi:MAG: hypothetical protein KJZ87_17765, partial [Thermoguttaceae bacterium]|nr:hypothetical protein [Thermoguttaceae bacterium]